VSSGLREVPLRDGHKCEGQKKLNGRKGHAGAKNLQGRGLGKPSKENKKTNTSLNDVLSASMEKKKTREQFVKYLHVFREGARGPHTRKNVGAVEISRARKERGAEQRPRCVTGRSPEKHF